MVVKCPQCQAKFNLADGKVTEKGLKVRCSKCKNVFEVKKGSAQAPEVVLRPQAAEDEDKFNFGEEFDFAEEKISTERPPQTPAHQDYAFADEPSTPAKAKKEIEEFSFEDEEADFSASDEPGAESKPRDLGMSPEMPEIPGSEAEEDFSVGDSPLSEGMDDFKIDRGSEIPARGGGAKPAKAEESGEEFDFSARLESYARPEAPGKAKAEAADDLEAQIDLDTESAPPTVAAETAQVHDFRPPAPSRPMPMHYEKKKGGGLKIFLILALILILLSPVGGLLYLNSTGSFTFSDLGKGNLAKLKGAPEINQILVKLGLAKPEIKGEVAILKEGVTYQTVRGREGGAVAVVQGKVRNDYPVQVRFIQVEVTLYDANRNALAIKTSYGDVYFSKTELATMPQADIEGLMDIMAGRNFKNNGVDPGGKVDFAVVFFQIPAGVANFDVILKNFEVIKGGG